MDGSKDRGQSVVTANDSALVGTGNQSLHRIVLDVEVALRILRQVGLPQGEYSSAAGDIHCLSIYYLLCLRLLVWSGLVSISYIILLIFVLVSLAYFSAGCISIVYMIPLGAHTLVASHYTTKPFEVACSSCQVAAGFYRTEVGLVS